MTLLWQSWGTLIHPVRWGSHYDWPLWRKHLCRWHWHPLHTGAPWRAQRRPVPGGRGSHTREAGWFATAPLQNNEKTSAPACSSCASIPFQFIHGILSIVKKQCETNDFVRTTFAIISIITDPPPLPSNPGWSQIPMTRGAQHSRHLINVSHWTILEVWGPSLLIVLRITFALPENLYLSSDGPSHTDVPNVPMPYMGTAASAWKTMIST